MLRKLINLWGWFMAALALGVFWVGTSATEPIRTIAFNVGAVLLTIALISWPYEWHLKDAVRDELLRLVGIERSISAAGLAQIADESKIDWQSLLEAATVVRALLTDPLTWIEREWRHVLTAAGRRAVRVTVYLPSPDGPHLEKLARRVHLRPPHFGERVRASLERLESTWKEAAGAGRIRNNSSLKVAYYPEAADYTLIGVDSAAVVVVRGPIDSAPSDRNFAMVYKGDSGLPMQLFERQFGRLEDLPAAYANEVRE